MKCPKAGELFEVIEDGAWTGDCIGDKCAWYHVISDEVRGCAVLLISKTLVELGNILTHISNVVEGR